MQTLLKLLNSSSESLKVTILVLDLNTAKQEPVGRARVGYRPSTHIQEIGGITNTRLPSLESSNVTSPAKARSTINWLSGGRTFVAIGAVNESTRADKLHINLVDALYPQSG